MSTISTILPAPVNNKSYTLNGSIASGGLSIVLNEAITDLPSEGVGAVFAKDTDGVVTTTSVEFVHWTSKNNGSKTLSLTDTGDRGLDGSYNGAQAHSSGDYFEMWVHSSYYPYAFMTTSHRSDGQHNFGTLYDTNGNEQVTTSATASAVNNVQIANAATGNGPSLSAVGDDSNVPITITSKGSGNTTITSPTGEVRLTAKTKADVTYGAITDAGSVSSGTTTFNWATTNRHKITLTGSAATLAMSNQTAGQTMLLEIVQDGTGSRTVSAWTSITWAGGVAPTLTTTASKRDLIGFYYNGSITIGFPVGQNI